MQRHLRVGAVQRLAAPVRLLVDRVAEPERAAEVLEAAGEPLRERRPREVICGAGREPVGERRRWSECAPLTVVDRGNASAGLYLARALSIGESPRFETVTRQADALSDDDLRRSAEEMVALYAGWCDRYPIVSIEDGMAENDWEGWKRLTDKLGNKLQLVGDDLFVTNTKFLQKGIDLGSPIFCVHKGFPLNSFSPLAAHLAPFG